MENEKKELGKWWVWILLLVVISIAALSVLTYFGKIGSTVVENEVFKRSYQRQSGLAAEHARYEAELAKVNSLLSSESDNGTIRALKAQKAMLEVQLTANERKD